MTNLVRRAASALALLVDQIGPRTWPGQTFALQSIPVRTATRRPH